MGNKSSSGNQTTQHIQTLTTHVAAPAAPVALTKADQYIQSFLEKYPEFPGNVRIRLHTYRGKWSFNVGCPTGNNFYALWVWKLKVDAAGENQIIIVYDSIQIVNVWQIDNMLDNSNSTMSLLVQHGPRTVRLEKMYSDAVDHNYNLYVGFFIVRSKNNQPTLW